MTQEPFGPFIYLFNMTYHRYMLIKSLRFQLHHTLNNFLPVSSLQHKKVFLCLHYTPLCIASVTLMPQSYVCSHLIPSIFLPVLYLKSGISFKNCVKSTLHILAQIFVTVCKLRVYFFVGTFSNFISYLCAGDRSTGKFMYDSFGLNFSLIF